MILAIETSAEPASLSLAYHDGTNCITHTFPNQNAVNTTLPPQLESLLPTPSPLTQILVGSGPGSFAGARVGLATAQAIALTYRCPLITLPSLHGVSSAATLPNALIGDARNQAYYLLLPSDDAPRLYTNEELLPAFQPIASQYSWSSFDPVNKLPLPDSLRAQITTTSSSSEALVQHWTQLSPNTQSKLQDTTPSILYLRPPFITQSKNPFAPR